MRRISWRLWSVGLLVLAGCSRPVAPLADVPLPAPTPAPALQLPRDAGPHDALTEWWYYTGHLRSDRDGREYGFEFVVFQVQRQSAPTGYLAHFAVSDIQGQRFSHQARFSQAETASTSTFPLDVSVDVSGWRLDHNGSADLIQAAMQPGQGAESAYALRLRLADEKPAALHHGGYIDYGAPGGSYYYSRTRLRVSGDLSAPDGSDGVPVSGVAWMDHQWGNFVVTAAGGWDWYSLQLDDQTELMLYVLRGTGGEATGVYGTRVLADGHAQEIAPDAVGVTATGSWTSPHTAAVYPSGWHLNLPDGVQLDIQPDLLDQELWFPDAARYEAMAYWEGAVTVHGDRTGVGYVELTGYAGH